MSILFILQHDEHTCAAGDFKDVYTAEVHAGLNALRQRRHDCKPQHPVCRLGLHGKNTSYRPNNTMTVKKLLIDESIVKLCAQPKSKESDQIFALTL